MLAVALCKTVRTGVTIQLTLKNMFIRTVVTLLRLHLQHLVFFKKKGRFYNHGPFKHLRFRCGPSLWDADR